MLSLDFNLLSIFEFFDGLIVPFSILKNVSTNISTSGNTLMPSLFCMTHFATLVSKPHIDKIFACAYIYDEVLLGKANLVTSSSIGNKAHL